MNRVPSFSSLNLRSASIALLVLTILLFSPTQGINAASITVNSTCSLAGAITAANTDTATGGCAAGSGADTITLSADITLSGALPQIASEITIEGADQFISGDDSYRIFYVEESGSLTLNRLQLKNGSSHTGGAIYNVGTVTVTNSQFSSNSVRNYGGAIANLGGTITITSSSLTNNSCGYKAGAIYGDSLGTITVNSSTLSSNSADDVGGALAVNGSYVTINNSKLNNNSSPKGGAIWNSALSTINNSELSNNSSTGHGGAIYANGNRLTVTNSTISGNSASGNGGGVYVLFVSGRVYLKHVTVVSNSAASGGGVYRAARSTLNSQNGIIAGNTGGDCVGGLLQNINNLIQDNSCSPALSGNPMLGTLTGSPAYYPLLSGSPAINAAHADHCPSSDQTGQGRPYPAGGACDIGAFEFQSDSVAATLAPTATSTPAEAAIATTSAADMPIAIRFDFEPPNCNLAVHVWIDASVHREGVEGYEFEILIKRPWSDTYSRMLSQRIRGDGIRSSRSVTTRRNSQNFEVYARMRELNGTWEETETVSCGLQTATPSVTHNSIATPSEFCIRVGPGSYWLFFTSRFLNGIISVYPDEDCEEFEVIPSSIGDLGYVYTANVQDAAADLCTAAHDDGVAYTAIQQAVNNDVWQCALPEADTPVPTATNTYVPPTNTAIPPTNTLAPVNSRAVVGVDPVSNRPGELDVSWDAPSETPRDYRISWAPIDEDFKTWTDSSGNAFPTSPSQTITGLDQGVAYKVVVRARYDGSSGPWTETVEALVMDEIIAAVFRATEQEQTVEPLTNTPVPTATNTTVPTATNTPVPTATNTTVPTATNTPISTATNTTVPTGTNTPVPTNTPVQPTAIPFGNPTELTASVKSDGITLSWTATRFSAADH